MTGWFDQCVYCGAPGCADDTAEHALDCPSCTGIFPVEHDMLGYGARCGSCGHEFDQSENYMLRELAHDTDDHPLVWEVVCVGCAAHDSLVG